MNDIFGNYPIVIGGWAVHSYTKGEMSQDIDIAIYDYETYYRRIEDEYFPEHNFIQYNKDTESAFWGKPVTDSNDQPEIVQFDIIIVSEKQTIRNLNIIKDWSLLVDNIQEANLDDLKIYIPKRELLINQKIIASLERKQDLRIERIASLIDRFNGKIKKDYLDIASLIKIGELDKELLKKFYEISQLTPHIDKFLPDYEREDYQDIFTKIKIDLDTIKAELTI